jgi:hypothetical protein
MSPAASSGGKQVLFSSDMPSNVTFVPWRSICSGLKSPSGATITPNPVPP